MKDQHKRAISYLILNYQGPHGKCDKASKTKEKNRWKHVVVVRFPAKVFHGLHSLELKKPGISKQREKPNRSGCESSPVRRAMILKLK
jgi:hypothetical protein